MGQFSNLAAVVPTPDQANGTKNTKSPYRVGAGNAPTSDNRIQIDDEEDDDE